MELHDWEAFLAPYLSKIELLSEIPLERAAYKELENAIGEFVRHNGLTEATRRLRSEYPAAFVTFLAFKAAFNDERGFWGEVARTTKQDSQQSFFQPTHHWGKEFLEVIGRHPNLRRFAGVTEQEYITPIRLHGGIPAFSLPDFFQYILLPSVEKTPYDGMDDEAALKELLKHYTAQLFVDDVVRHFFTYAGEPAYNFFRKCRHMARLTKNEETLPSPQDLGLRPYVVQIFENFQQYQPQPSTRRRKPRLGFDPYIPAFRLLFPAQPLSLEQAGVRYDARLFNPVTGVVYAERNRIRPRRQGQDWLIEEVEWLLEEPLQTVQAGLFTQSDEKPLISYSLRILPATGYPPLLAFRYSDQRQVRLSPSLPAGDLWLFYPAHAELCFEGRARPLEKLNPFAMPWNDWQAAAWDLSQVRLLRLLCNGQDLCSPIAVSHLLEPTLSASNLPLCLMAVDEKTLYDAAPHVCLPIQNPSRPTEELTDWHLRMESRYAASPQGVWEAKADELPYTIDNTEAQISLESWLKESPVGTYHLTLSRRGRVVTQLPFRVCAGLQIDGLHPYYLPTEQGAQSVDFTLRLSQNGSLLAEDESEVKIHSYGFKVRAAAEVSHVDLRLELPASSEPVRLPLRVAIPRLRWALTLEKGTALEWTNQPISRPLPEILQANLANSHPRLRVELPLQETEKPLVELHLTVPGRETPLQTSDSRLLASNWLEFDLSIFFDTLRAERGESIFEFQLELLDARRDLNKCLPVLRLARALDIRNCYFEALSGGNWRLHWYEPRPLRYRRVRLWSCWQPWADPVEIPLPDSAQPSHSTDAPGWWMYDIPAEFGLPPAEYQAQFVVVSPYEHKLMPSFPPKQTTKIQMLSPELRLQDIQNELAHAVPARAFALHFEKLCIYQTQELGQKKQDEIKWFLKHWREARLLHLEALARWLGEYDSQENQLAFQIHLFHEEMLKRLEEEHYPPEFVQRYLGNILFVHRISPGSVQRVLTLARDPVVILKALQILLKSDAEEARRAFWEFMEQGRFSEADAAALLKNSPDFALHLFRNTPASPLRWRLLRALSNYLDVPEYIVKEGYYVLCDVGWGKLLKIRGAEQDNFFFPEVEQPTLEVDLLHWPGQKVEIDLAERRFSLPGRQGINRCACGRFAGLGGRETEALWDKHLSICGHKRAAITPIPAQSALLNPLIYQVTQPKDPFDTCCGE